MKQTQNKHVHLWRRVSVLLLSAVCALMLFGGEKAYADEPSQLSYTSAYLDAYSLILDSSAGNWVTIDLSKYKGLLGTIIGEPEWSFSDESMISKKLFDSDNMRVQLKFISRGTEIITISYYPFLSTVKKTAKIVYAVHEPFVSTRDTTMATVKTKVIPSSNPMTNSAAYAFHDQGNRDVEQPVGSVFIVIGYVYNYTGGKWYKVKLETQHPFFPTKEYWVPESCLTNVDYAVDEISFVDTKISIHVGGRGRMLPVAFSYKNNYPIDIGYDSMSFSSSDKSIATVDQFGYVTGVKAGEATITLKVTCYGEKPFAMDQKVITYKVFVLDSAPGPETISLNKTSLPMVKGETATLTATVGPQNATDKSVTWTSSNTSIATVDANGKVTAKGVGACTITATANANIDLSKSCSVTVKAPVTADTEKPVIQVRKLENADYSGFKVVATATDNVGVKYWKIAFWNDEMGLADDSWSEVTKKAIWITVSAGSELNKRIYFSNYFDTVPSTTWHANVYAFDAADNQSMGVRAGDIFIDLTRPVAEAAAMSVINSKSIRVTAEGVGSSPITLWRIGVWSDKTGLPDEGWSTVNKMGTVYPVAADSDGKLDTVISLEPYLDDLPATIHVKCWPVDVFSNGGISVKAGEEYVTNEKPVIQERSIINVTKEGYDVVFRATDDYGIVSARIATWNDEMGLPDDSWSSVMHMARLEDEDADGSIEVTFTHHVSFADFGNVRDTYYHTNIYVYDNDGNQGMGVRAGNEYILDYDGADILYLDSVKTIEEEAFIGTSFTVIRIGKQCTKIGSNAFANITTLKYVIAPEKLDLQNAGIPSGTVVIRY